MQLPVTVKDQEVDFIFVGSGFFFFLKVFFSLQSMWGKNYKAGYSHSKH